MRRKIFTLAAAVSAVLCVPVVALWVLGYWCIDRWVWDPAPNRISISSYSGKVFFVRVVPPPGGVAPAWPDGPGHHVELLRPVAAEAVPAWEAAGFGYAFLKIGPDAYTSYRVPVWSLAVLAASLPAAWALTRKRRTIRPGHCPGCGYDLRATPERCPECGAVATTTWAAS